MKDAESLKAELQTARDARDAVLGDLEGCQTFATPSERRRWLLENRALIGRLLDQLKVLDIGDRGSG